MVAAVVVVLVMTVLGGGALYLLADAGGSGGTGEEVPDDALDVVRKIPVTRATTSTGGASGLPDIWVKDDVLVYGDGTASAATTSPPGGRPGGSGPRRGRASRAPCPGTPAPSAR